MGWQLVHEPGAGGRAVGGLDPRHNVSYPTWSGSVVMLAGFVISLL